MDVNELENLKYHELQKLAKAKGIRANMKVEKLRKALKDHYESDVSNSATDNSSSTDHESEKENSPKIKKTRGRKGGRKKKDVETSNDEDTSDEKKTTEEEQPVKQTRNKKTRNTKKSKKGEVELKSPVPNKPVKTSTSKSPFASIKSPAMKKATPTLVSKSSKLTPTTLKSPVVARKQPTVNDNEIPPKRKRSNSKEEKKENVEQQVEVQEVEPSAKRLRKNSSPPKVNTPTRTSLTKSSSKNNTPKNNTPKQGKRKSSSPGVKSMIQAMDGLSSEQMKATLLEALDKKVAENPGRSSQVSNIPRFTASVGQNSEKADQKTGNTPDWKKIHKKEFSRWDNLEVYMEKRKKRAEGLTGSFKSVHKLLKETQTAVDRLKSIKTPQIVVPVKKDSIRSSFQSPKVFKPSTTSTKNLNLKFGANKTPVVQSNSKTPRLSTTGIRPTPKSSSRTVTPSVRTVANTSSGVKHTKSSDTPKSIIGKRSASRQSTTQSKSPASRLSTAKPKSPASRQSTVKPKTPAETLVKPRINIKPSSTVKSSPSCNRSLINITHKSNKLSIGDGFTTGGTPMKFKGLNTSILNSSMKKPSFDLKASLSRPVTWKAHKGKLKPLDLNTTYKTFDKTSYKTPQTQTIKDRRRDVQANRADKKFESQMRKRGISLA